MEKIKRFAQVELRTRESEERTIEGFASVFNQETDIGGWFYEKIDRHAFDNCDMSDVYLLMNHDPNLILAGTQNNSLELSVNDNGLYQKSKIVETSQGNDYLQLVKEGLIRKMSFGFTIDGNEGDVWTTDEDGNEHRTITKIDRLFDVSIVTYPAYEGTSVRSMDELDEGAKRHLEEKRMLDNQKTSVVEETVEEVRETVEETTEEVEETQVEEVREAEQVETNEEPTNDIHEEEGEERTMNTNFSNVEVRAEDIKAWRASLMQKEDRAGLKSTDANVPVPTVFQGYVETAWDRLTLLNKIPYTSVSAKQVIPFESSADGAYNHQEGTSAIAEEALELGATVLDPEFIKKWISTTDKLEQMADDDFMRYLADEIVYQVFKKLQDEIVVGTGFGSGTNKTGTVGIINAPLTVAITEGLGFNTANKAVSKLADDASDVVAIMNRATFFDGFMGLTNLQGTPIFQISADNTGKPRYFVNGIEAIFNNKLPSYATAEEGDEWLIVGDLRGYKLNLPQGKTVRMIKDEYTLMTEDKIRTLGKILSAGNVTKLGHFVAVKKPAEEPAA